MLLIGGDPASRKERILYAFLRLVPPSREALKL